MHVDTSSGVSCVLIAVAYVNWEIADYTIDRIRDDFSDGRPGIRTALAVTLRVACHPSYAVWVAPTRHGTPFGVSLVPDSCLLFVVS